MAVFLYAAVFGVLYFVISITVIKARRTNRISLGAGNNNEIEKTSYDDDPISNLDFLFGTFLLLFSKSPSDHPLRHLDIRVPCKIFS